MLCVAAAFAKAMANACFVPLSQADLVKLQAALQKDSNYTVAQVQELTRQGKVRRFIPDPETLAENVVGVMMDFQNVVDTVTQQPLLTSEVWEQFFRNLKKVTQGLLTGQQF